MTVGTFDVLVVATVGAMGIVGVNFFGTANTTTLLHSARRLYFGIKHNPLKELDQPKTQ